MLYSIVLVLDVLGSVYTGRCAPLFSFKSLISTDIVLSLCEEFHAVSCGFCYAPLCCAVLCCVCICVFVCLCVCSAALSDVMLFCEFCSVKLETHSTQNVWMSGNVPELSGGKGHHSLTH